jgi:hypothetical protein
MPSPEKNSPLFGTHFYSRENETAGRHLHGELKGTPRVTSQPTPAPDSEAILDRIWERTKLDMAAQEEERRIIHEEQVAKSRVLSEVAFPEVVEIQPVPEE